MWESGRMVKDMGKVLIKDLMEVSMRESGRMVN
jgi:hypothetical protein